MQNSGKAGAEVETLRGEQMTATGKVSKKTPLGRK